MQYKTLVHLEQHVYKYTPAKKLSDTVTAMAGVEVYNSKGVKIGGYAFSRSPKNQFDTQVTDMVKEIIRDFELRKIWNR